MLLLLTPPVVVQAQFDYVTNNGTITITGYNGPGGEVEIPDTIDGLPVASIGSNAFYRKHSVTSVTMPNSVTSIESGAFDYCVDLTNVTIPHSVTNIGYAAFFYCPSLTALTVGVFNSFYSSVDGVLFNRSQTLLIACPAGRVGSYTIPKSVTRIAQGAFEYCKLLRSVTIPDGVTSIEPGTFYECNGLGNITIPNSITRIGDNAFRLCMSLNSLKIPDSVTNIGHGAFSGCGLTSFTIPNSVTSIGDYSFQGCPNLTSITIPNSVISIGDYAFDSCVSLTSITIPNSVTNIGNFAFAWCYFSLTSITIPYSVRSIGDFAFSYNPSLTGVYFQGNVPSFGSGLFAESDNVTAYYLPGTTGWGTTFAGRPAVLWNPLVPTSHASFGVRTNRFGFTITGASNLVLVVEASTHLVNPTWIPLGTNTLTGGSSYFSDPQWTNHSARFYRIRSP